jgi:hypothetical protein
VCVCVCVCVCCTWFAYLGINTHDHLSGGLVFAHLVLTLTLEDDVDISRLES